MWTICCCHFIISSDMFNYSCFSVSIKSQNYKCLIIILISDCGVDKNCPVNLLLKWLQSKTLVDTVLGQMLCPSALNEM